MRTLLHRAAGASALIAAASLLVSSGLVGTTFGLFNAETRNDASAFAGGWVDPPASATATASGYDMNLAWTPGTHGPVTGQTLAGVVNGTNSNCTGAALSPIATLASASTATYTDSSRATQATDGDYVCYQLVSKSATVWTAAVNFSAQIGLFATAIAANNASSTCSKAPAAVTGVIDCNDTIVITFNQKPLAPTSTVNVCTWAGTGTSGSIVIGDTNGTACNAAGDAFNIGRLTGMAIGTSIKFLGSAVSVSASAPWTMTITLAGATKTSTTSGTSTFNGSTGVLSAATTHQAQACNVITGTVCRPTAALAF